MMEYRISLIGKGNVGSSFLQLLKDKKNEIDEKYDIITKIIGIFETGGALIDENGLDLKALINDYEGLKSSKLWKDNIHVLESISDLKLNLCIEATPTSPIDGEPALSHILEALKNKIDVISSNKAPFYLNYPKIMNLAEKNDCFVRFEATVGSCIPVLSIKENLSGIPIIGISAILNGTSNYILSRMASESISFEVALKEAQERGIAESDPSIDVEGLDAAGKIVILANVLLEKLYSLSDVKIEGISKITPQALELASIDGFVIKPLAIVSDDNIMVEPRLIKKDSPLNVGGTSNIIELITAKVGSIFLMGRGAGGLEAASAILNDMLYIIKKRKIIECQERSSQNEIPFHKL